MILYMCDAATSLSDPTLHLLTVRRFQVHQMQLLTDMELVAAARSGWVAGSLNIPLVD